MARTTPTTAEQPTSKTHEEVIKEAKRIEEGLLYSSKGHFAAAGVWGHFHLIVGIPLVALSAVAGTAYVKNLPSDSTWALAIPVVIAILSALLTFLNPSEKASAHFKAGNECDSLMNRVRIFWSIDCLMGEPDKVLAKKVEDFSDEKSKLNKASPQIPFWGYWWARRGIRKGEGEYSVDKPKPQNGDQSKV